MAGPKFTIRDAKLDRLLRYKGLSSQDEFRANYIYEERANKNFLHNSLNGAFWSSLYVLLFRGQSKTVAFPVLSGLFLLTFAVIRDRNNRTMDYRLDPLFEKYKIK